MSEKTVSPVFSLTKPQIELDSSALKIEKTTRQNKKGNLTETAANKTPNNEPLINQHKIDVNQECQVGARSSHTCGVYIPQSDKVDN